MTDLEYALKILDAENARQNGRIEQLENEVNDLKQKILVIADRLQKVVDDRL